MTPLTSRMVRVVLGGAELDGLAVDQPAASVRLLVPTPGDDALLIPTWNGNEFLRPDGSRPIIRTFTPRRFDAEALTLELEIVVHGSGAVADWVRRATPGDPAAISGTGRGYDVPGAAGGFLLGGDESAIPAIGQLLEALPSGAAVTVIVEIGHPDARLELPSHPGAAVRWVEAVPDRPPGDALHAAIADTPIEADTKVWVAGEAAAVHRIRKHLFDERGVGRRDATVRGYWKLGKAGGPE